jgi:nitronate monooxygenase
MTTLTQLLGIDLPILQAPMAGSQGSALAIAVSNAGGLGALPGALLSLDTLRDELTAIRAGTDRPYNVNFFCHEPPIADPAREAAWHTALAPYCAEFKIDPSTMAAAGGGRAPFSDAVADVLEEFRPPVISFHFGLPNDALLARIRRWGSRILSSATTLHEARWLDARGVDAIIAQGLQAGGHRGHFLSPDLALQTDTLPLLAILAGAMKTPVIAAGGIGDARDVAAAFATGASAVQVGTAFLLCPEADTRPAHRAALLRAATQGGQTALTNVFTGRPARGLVNRAMLELGPLSPIAPAFPLAATAMAPLRAAAEENGSGDFSPLWSGQGIGGCRVMPAAELVRELAAAVVDGRR